MNVNAKDDEDPPPPPPRQDTSGPVGCAGCGKPFNECICLDPNT